MVGHINKPHGTKGEVFVWPLTDHPGEVFAPGVVVHPAEDEGVKPDLGRPALRIESVRPFRKGFLIRFEGRESRSDAESLRGLYLLRPRKELREPGEGEWFYHELLGLRVETAGGAFVGEITEVYELRPAHLLEVRGEEGEILIPMTVEIVVSVDRERGVMVVDPPDGLLEP